jgi:hypothetical protein
MCNAWASREPHTSPMEAAKCRFELTWCKLSKVVENQFDILLFGSEHAVDTFDTSHFRHISGYYLLCTAFNMNCCSGIYDLHPPISHQSHINQCTCNVHIMYIFEYKWRPLRAHAGSTFDENEREFLWYCQPQSGCRANTAELRFWWKWSVIFVALPATEWLPSEQSRAHFEWK